jgi:hypothetical protein
LTVRETVAACVTVVPAPVPVMVTVTVPSAAVDDADNVTFEDPPAVTNGGTNEAVTPAGRPVTESPTVCARPDVTAVETVADTEALGDTDTDPGDTDIEKSFGTVVVTGVVGEVVGVVGGVTVAVAAVVLGVVVGAVVGAVLVAAAKFALASER